MDIKFMFSCSIVLILFFIKLNTAQKLGEYLVRRTQTYDEIKFDGDCNILDAASTVRSGKKWCHCEKFLEVNNVKTVLYGSLLVYANPSRQARIKCVYDYRETGANFFISPSYSAKFATFTVRDKDVKRHITKGANIFVATRYPSDTVLYVDDMLVYDNWKRTYVKHNRPAFVLKKISISDSDEVMYALALVAGIEIIHDLAGRMPRVLLNGSNSQGKLYGFTVVKFIGERTYKLHIGTEPTKNTPYFSTSQIIIYSLVGVACVLILVMILLIWKLRRKSRNKKHSLEIREPKLKILQEKEVNSNNESKKYEQLSTSLMKADYQEIPEEFHFNSRPQKHSSEIRGPKLNVLLQEKQVNVKDESKKYEQLSIPLTKENYQDIPEDFHLNSKPQNVLQSQTKVENRKSVENIYECETIYENVKRNCPTYMNA